MTRPGFFFRHFSASERPQFSHTLTPSLSKGRLFRLSGDLGPKRKRLVEPVEQPGAPFGGLLRIYGGWSHFIGWGVVGQWPATGRVPRQLQRHTRTGVPVSNVPEPRMGIRAPLARLHGSERRPDGRLLVPIPSAGFTPNERPHVVRISGMDQIKRTKGIAISL